MSETTVDYPRLWGHLASRGLHMRLEEFKDLDIKTELNPMIEMAEFSKRAIDKIWVKKYGAFEVH